MNENINSKICPKCGIANALDSKFCIQCGESLEIPQTKLNDTRVEPSVEMKINDTTQPIQQNSVTSGDTLDYFRYIIGAFLKPYDKYKEKENSLEDVKNISILALILVGIATIVNLISTMISTVRVVSIWSSETKWVWANLKNVPYLKIIGLNLLVYAGALLAIAGVYFLASLVIKKNIKYVKLLAISTTAFIPFVAAAIASPIIGLIYSPLGLCVSVVGFIYSLLILLELTNDIIVIENKNVRIYFHLICLSVIVIVGGFITYKVLLSSLTSSLGLLGSLF